jgi:hypothetical protein
MKTGLLFKLACLLIAAMVLFVHLTSKNLAKLRVKSK